MVPLALQLASNDDPPVWRLLALIAIAIALCTYVSLLIREQRRPKQNPLPPDTYTINLWKVKFPELNHLPEPERERLLRSAIEHAEVEKSRRRVGRPMKIIFYGATAILMVAAVTSSLPAWLATICFLIGLLILLIATIFLRIQFQLKIVRHFLKQSLLARDNTDSSGT